MSNLFRGGVNMLQNAIGVLGYDFSLYRIVPTGVADYTAVNPRPAAPEPWEAPSWCGRDEDVGNFYVTADYPALAIHSITSAAR